MNILTTQNLITLMNTHRNKNNCALPKFTLSNGSTLSIQASEIHWCSPKKSGANWFEVEVMCSSPEWIKKFGEKPDNIYEHVPIAEVVKYINDIGYFQ